MIYSLIIYIGMIRKAKKSFLDAHNKTFNLKKQTIIFVIHVVAVFTGFSYSLVIDKDLEIIVEIGKM